MITLLAGIIAAVVAALLLRFVWLESGATPRSTAVTLGIGFPLLAIVALALTGRLHWIAGVIAAIVPLLRPLAGWLLPSLVKRWSSSAGTGGGGGSGQRGSAEMSREQAYRVLGLTREADASAIRAAHRKLMQRLHPDRGGSDYLATTLNEARRVLLRD